MADMNHHYALHRSSSNDDFELISATRKSPPEGNKNNSTQNKF